MSSHQGQEQDPRAGPRLYRGGASLPCQPPWGASPPGLTLGEGGRQGSFSGTAMMEVLAATEPGTHGRQRKDGQGDARAHVERAGRRPLAAGGWGRACGREPAHSHRDLSWPGTGQQVTPGAPSTHSSPPRSSGAEVPRNPQAVQGSSGGSQQGLGKWPAGGRHPSRPRPAPTLPDAPGPRPGVQPPPRSRLRPRPAQPARRSCEASLRSTQALCLLLSLHLSEQSPIPEARLLLRPPKAEWGAHRTACGPRVTVRPGQARWR